ncbi:MAG TPA: M23 family metallopeptidase [Deinococcales bacterium]|nr:M23 family metallopeptidase [Deinococcales bacterium]
MRLKPGRVLLGLILLGLAVWGVQSFLEWRGPPDLVVEVPERVPAGEFFEVNIQSNKPVDMQLTAGESTLNNAGSAWSVYLPGRSGSGSVQLEIADRAGNRVERHISVTGVPEPELTLQTSGEPVAGDPFSAWLQVDAAGNRLGAVELLLNGESVPRVDFRGGEALFRAVPFEAEGDSIEVEAWVVDEFGREFRVSESFPVLPIDRPVELILLTGDTLSLLEEDNAARQEERMAEVLAESAPAPLWTEPFLLPVEGVSSSGYGDPRRYYEDGPVSWHRGADLAAPAGTPIHATNDGVVVLAEELPISGFTVVIDHGGGVSSHYFHQSLLLVSEGEEVHRGDTVGEVGSTGLSTGPHLHWEMRVHGESTNPLVWVDAVLPGVETGD